MIHIALLAAVLQTAPTPPPPRVDCTDADHRAFDFWLGEWDVRPTGTETVVAVSVISRAAGGCAVEENYHQTVGPGGAAANYVGSSLSVFDQAGGGRWRQFYVDSGGTLTVFEGRAVADGMVLDAPSPTGALQRMSFTAQPDGSVRQWGQVSSDGGATWTSGGYDFTYRRRPAA